MNRYRIVLLAAALFICSVGLFAQTGGSGTAPAAGNGLEDQASIRSPSDFVPIRVDVTKIFIHAKGYRVIYRKGETSFADVYIPVEWFVPGGKAQLIVGRGPAFPYLVVFYKADGSMSHLKLYAPRNMSDPAWGRLTGDVGESFKVDTVKLQF